jgi:RNA polymerase sigma-70 factor (ECF subfamily)
VTVVEPERFAQHRDRLHRAAWALCASPHDADDLVQETYVRVLSRPRRLRGREELPYLLRTLRNTYLTTLRTAGRRPRTVTLVAVDLGGASYREAAHALGTREATVTTRLHRARERVARRVLTDEGRMP